MEKDDQTILQQSASEKKPTPDLTKISQSSVKNSQHKVNCDNTVVTPQSVNSSIVPKPVPLPASSSNNNSKIIKGRFELINLLGSGGMGAVYKALDRRKVEASDSNPYVAVKVLNSDFRQHPDAFISLQRESRKSQTLAHPNIVTVYDFDRDKDLVFMTMEYLTGAPLDELLRSSPKGLPLEQANSILLDISNALTYAHSHQIIHSDFKPGNIFVTEDKGTKVFDFGIARAVSTGSSAHQAGEKTIFDASTLGALTPAYASYEMLTGKEPSASDDVFALGCVAYELFSGRHPYDKTPADKALSKNLKPTRLKNLSRRQWKALSKALELTRDKRTATVSEFSQVFFGSARTLIWALVASLVAISATGAVYFQQQTVQAEKQKQLQAELQADMVQQLEDSMLKNQRRTVERLVQIASLSPKWDSETRKELIAYQELAPDDFEFVQSTRTQVANAYLEKSKLLINNEDLDEIPTLLSYAQRWGANSNDTTLLLNQVHSIQETERLRIENKQLAEAQEETNKLKAEQEKIRQAQIRQEVTRLEGALRCTNQIKVAGGIDEHLNILEALAPERKAAMHSTVTNALVTCFDKLKLSTPFLAENLLNEAKALLPEQKSLQTLKIDYCAHLPAGSGNRGRRFSCADPLPNNNTGPTMVVVPSAESTQKLAITQLEITYHDLAAYCEVTELCDAKTYRDNYLPVHNISLDFAQNFAKWLSTTTGFEYRIPEYNEWLIAAKADGSQESASRNCSIQYEAIIKGTELVGSNNDDLNAYGLASTVGNVQEWAFKNGALVAAGGSRLTPMYECRYSTVQPHTGKPDEVTGFRLARNLLY